MTFVGNRFLEASVSHTWHPRRDSSNESKNMDALETKLEQLKLAVTRTDSIIALNNEVAMERHPNAIKALTMEADLAKWVCIFCFEMKGAPIFDGTVLCCDHLVCIKCFKKNADFLKTMCTCHCGATFPESA